MTSNHLTSKTSGIDGAVRALIETDPQGHQSRSYFDGEYNLLAQTNAKGETTRYAYDMLGRLTEVKVPSRPDLSKVYRYDAQLQCVVKKYTSPTT